MDQKPHKEPPPIKIPPVGERKHEEALLDQAVAETMIASDPISPAARDLMEPVGATPADRRRQARRSSDSSVWVFVAVTAVALLALRALSRRSPD